MVKPRKAPGEDKRRLTKWQLILPVILIGIGTGIAYLINHFILGGKQPIEQCISSEDLPFRLHAMLEVTIDGKAVSIPENIGRSKECLRPLHTKDGGNVYIVYSRPIRFTLMDLIRLWGLDTSKYDVSIWVKTKGGQEYVNVGNDPSKVVFEDGMSIRMELSSK